MTGTWPYPADPLAGLTSAEGTALLGRLAGQPATPETALRLGARLREEYPAALVAAALSQHELRIAAQGKFSRAAGMFFTRDGLEQASAELISAHRAPRYAGAGRVADLCCGIGGDLLALAGQHDVLAVDRDPVHLRMALANAAAYGVADRVTVRQADVREAALDGVDAVFIDPARRSGRGRLRPGDSEPPLAWCLGLADRVPRVGIKAAPGVARDAVPPGWELEFVAVGRDLKEATAWSPALASPVTGPVTSPALAGPALAGRATRATVLPGGHTLVPQPGPPVPVAPPGPYLLDPNPAVTRAGLVAELARAAGAWQIDGRIAFLCTETPVATPFARTLRVTGSLPWNHRAVAARLRELGIGAVDIRRRGLAGDVDQVRRQLKLSGPGRATLVMTRAADRPWALICTDLPAPACPLDSRR